jgi:acyl-CoA thioester hydrolase
MPEYRFHIPVEARYGDLDPQWHVNNVRYLSFLEQARLAYLVKLGLWDGHDFNNLGLIVADIHIAYLAPMLLWQKTRLFMRTSKIGNKSLTFEYELVDENSQAILARAESIMVAYDYTTQKSIPVPPDWRARIGAYEGIDFNGSARRSEALNDDPSN